MVLFLAGSREARDYKEKGSIPGGVGPNWGWMECSAGHVTPPWPAKSLRAMVATVKERSYWLCIAVLGFGLASCSNDDQLFLGFDQLCALRAENICGARATSCCSEASVPPDCVEQETAACDAERERIAGLEPELTFHGQHASDKVDAENSGLSQCEAPWPLTQFFDGALAEGEACRRDTQCESGHCGSASGACESAEEVSLCPAE